MPRAAAVAVAPPARPGSRPGCSPAAAAAGGQPRSGLWPPPSGDAGSPPLPAAFIAAALRGRSASDRPPAKTARPARADLAGASAPDDLVPLRRANAAVARPKPASRKLAAATEPGLDRLVRIRPGDLGFTPPRTPVAARVKRSTAQRNRAGAYVRTTITCDAELGKPVLPRHFDQEAIDASGRSRRLRPRPADQPAAQPWQAPARCLTPPRPPSPSSNRRYPQLKGRLARGSAGPGHQPPRSPRRGASGHRPGPAQSSA